MTTCCLEDALQAKLRSFECTPIKPENHFIDVRQCEDCVPYVVTKIRTTAGLRTSDQLQKLHQIDISAYFADSQRPQALAYRDLIEAWVFAKGCLDLGVCGCFCQQGQPVSTMNPPAGGRIRYNITFRGSYKASELGSESMSASLSASV